jgi:hypothetical protein
MVPKGGSENKVPGNTRIPTHGACASSRGFRYSVLDFTSERSGR